MYITTGDKMKKIVIPIIFITLIGIIIFNQNKEKEIITQVITYREDIDKINETCHLRNNKFDLELNIEFLNSTSDNKIIVYGNDIEEFNNYLYENYYLENKLINVTLNNEGYIYEIFSIFISKEDDYNHTKLLFRNNEYQEHITYLINESMYDKVSIPTNSKIITIQKSIGLNKYLIINARRI
jgi:hypothetical protein